MDDQVYKLQYQINALADELMSAMNSGLDEVQTRKLYLRLRDMASQDFLDALKDTQFF